jgi:2,4-dienoyl-CoA reductase-like NADH-dependent reductase (Old Yellow Enzyme family)/thioredoxin reductase
MATLFDPIRIGSMDLKNRIIFPPMTTGYEVQGAITPRSINFYTMLAAGGAGLIVLGDCSTQPTMSATPAIYDDRFIPGLTELTDAVHAAGAKIAAQIFHQEYDAAEIGRLAREEGKAAAFKKLHVDMQTFCNTLTIEQIHAIQQKYIDGAVRAVKAGFDAVQIHGDRLIGMFCSPIMNKRTDEYGGSIENRARFGLEIVAGMRAALPDTPLDYKLALIRTDPPMGKGGPTIEEGVWLAPQLVAAGVDSFHVAIANHTDIAITIPPMGTMPKAAFLDLAEVIKAVVDVPVATVGRIVEPDLARSIVAEGRADMVALGRPLICDTEWPNKAQAGEDDTIRLCLNCNRGCTDNLLRQQPVSCVLNPFVGHDVTPELAPAEAPKRVMVVGGGPAGMQAAITAQSRGHHVSLYEASGELGGQLLLAAIPPMKDEMSRAIVYLRQEVERLGVDVQRNTRVDASLIASSEADVVVLATGARPARLDVPGADGANVVDAWTVIGGLTTVNDPVVVIGGGLVGVETAELLADQGHAVTIVEMLDEIGAGASPTMRLPRQQFMDAHDITVLTQHKLLAVTAAGVQLENTASSEAVEVTCGTVVMATGAQPDQTLADALTAQGIAFHAIGDCACDQARLLADAIIEGFTVGREI